MDLTATANDKCCADSLVAIQFFDFRSYRSRHLIHYRCSQFPHFFCRNLMLDQHDIFISDLLFCCTLQLDIFSRFKINQIILHDQFR